MTEVETLEQPQELDQAVVRTLTYPVVYNALPLRPEGHKTFHSISRKFIGVPDRNFSGAIMLVRALEELELQHWTVDKGLVTIEHEKKADVQVLFSGVVQNDFIAWTYDDKFDEWLADYLSKPRA